MVHANSNAETRGPERIASGGVDEAQIAQFSGLRGFHQQACLIDEAARFWLSGAGFDGATTIRKWTDISTIGGGASGALTNVTIPIASTPCISYTHNSATGQVLQFRVTGVDQFGIRIVEVTPEMTLQNPGIGSAPAAAARTAIARIWLAKTFSRIDLVEMAGSNLDTDDVMSVGLVYLWDKTVGEFFFWTDRTGGNITLTVTYPGTPSTTQAAVIAVVAMTKETVEATFRALADIVDVRVTGLGTLIDPFKIECWMPTLDVTNISITGSGTGGPIGFESISGPEFIGHENLGIASPFKVTATSRAVGGSLYPEILGFEAFNFTDRRLTHGTQTIVAAWPAAVDPTVILPVNHGLEPGTYVPIITHGTGAAASQGIWGGEVIDHNSIKLWGANGTGATAGTIVIFRGKLEESIHIPPAGGTRAVPTTAGYVIGVSAASGAAHTEAFEGWPHKVGLHLRTGAPALGGTFASGGEPGGFPLTPVKGGRGPRTTGGTREGTFARISDVFNFNIWWRSLDGTAQPPTNMLFTDA